MARDHAPFASGSVSRRRPSVSRRQERGGVRTRAHKLRHGQRARIRRLGWVSHRDERSPRGQSFVTAKLKDSDVELCPGHRERERERESDQGLRGPARQFDKNSHSLSIGHRPSTASIGHRRSIGHPEGRILREVPLTVREGRPPIIDEAHACMGPCSEILQPRGWKKEPDLATCQGFPPPPVTPLFSFTTVSRRPCRRRVLHTTYRPLKAVFTRFIAPDSCEPAHPPLPRLHPPPPPP